MARYLISTLRYERNDSNRWANYKVDMIQYIEIQKISWEKCFFLNFRKVLPPQTGELNIHFGVFFGGLGDFSESYLNSVDNFRGCMSDVRKDKCI